MIDRPQLVQFDLTDPYFKLQLQQLKKKFPHLLQELSAMLPTYVGMPWDAFETAAHIRYFEAAFDGSFLVLELQFARGELHIMAHLADDILVLVSVTKPILHI
ncbi:MAG: hypothetical protein QFF03_22960 [Pseudomonadota bacterium]|nr:hypothetical protein [Pseudomonadota bacterium]